MSVYKKYCSLKPHEEGLGVELVETSAQHPLYLSTALSQTKMTGRIVDLTL